MTISIVIPAFNEDKYLPNTLNSIKDSSRVFNAAGWESEIIVCDNNSTDATSNTATSYGARVVFEPFNQISSARNAAARVAKGDWLVFIDADTQVSSELFRSMMRSIVSKKYIGGGAPVKFDSGPWLACQTVHVWNSVAKIMGWAAGSFLFCEVNAFRKLNGFNNELFAAEEVEYCQRLNRLGKRFAKRFIMLSPPVITSGRKVKALFTTKNLEHGIEALLTAGDALKKRDKCEYWYDNPVR